MKPLAHALAVVVQTVAGRCGSVIRLISRCARYMGKYFQSTRIDPHAFQEPDSFTDRRLRAQISWCMGHATCGACFRSLRSQRRVGPTVARLGPFSTILDVAS